MNPVSDTYFTGKYGHSVLVSRDEDSIHPLYLLSPIRTELRHVFLFLAIISTRRQTDLRLDSPRPNSPAFSLLLLFLPWMDENKIG